MKLFLLTALALAAAACATPSPRDPALDAYPFKQSLREERARESAERMRDEFNALTGDAY